MKLFRRMTKTAVVFGMILLSGVIAGCGSKKEESYRSIKVYEVDGTAWVTREDVGEMELYANMQLQSNDQLRTDSKAYVQLKLDEDKYVLLEPDTRIKIEAEGNAENSRTKIILEEGAIVNRIENKLSDNSSYEVETPSSTMAVRGTTFRVSIMKDKTGKLVSEIDVQDGKVECKIMVKNQDGTVTEELVSLEAGKKTIINGTPEGADYVSGPMEYTYDEYENEVLNFIGYSEEKTDNEMNHENGDSEKEEMESGDLEKEEDESGESGNRETGSGNSEKEDTENKESQGEKETKEESTDSGNNSGSTNSGSSSGGTDSGSNSGSTDSGSSSGGTNSGSSSGGTDSGSSSGGTDSGSSSGGTDSGSSSGGTDSGTGDSGTGDGGNTDSGDEDSGTGDGGNDTSTCTVIFGLADGEFARQTVNSGSKATKPVLMPYISGKWSADGTNEFDFSTVITDNIVLLWVE